MALAHEAAHISEEELVPWILGLGGWLRLSRIAGMAKYRCPWLDVRLLVSVSRTMCGTTRTFYARACVALQLRSDDTSAAETKPEFAPA